MFGRSEATFLAQREIITNFCALDERFNIYKLVVYAGKGIVTTANMVQEKSKRKGKKGGS